MRGDFLEGGKPQNSSTTERDQPVLRDGVPAFSELSMLYFSISQDNKQLEQNDKQLAGRRGKRESLTSQRRDSRAASPSAMREHQSAPS